MTTNIQKARAAKKAKAALRKLRASDAVEVVQAIAEEATQKAVETEAKGGRVPGDIDETGHKVAWTLAEYDKRFKLITFVPETTVKLTLNGVERQMFANRECMVPEPFYSEYRRIMKQKASPPTLPESGHVNEIISGAGALQPEATREV